tara:strand:- start:48 stop:428 length:381 start_codon:yes stop_codon:yes gene_type:complete
MTVLAKLRDPEEKAWTSRGYLKLPDIYEVIDSGWEDPAADADGLNMLFRFDGEIIRGQSSDFDFISSNISLSGGFVRVVACEVILDGAIRWGWVVDEFQGEAYLDESEISINLNSASKEGLYDECF